jgi:Pvc16 N-terminal domain
MSNALAIAAVTETLRNLISQGLDAAQVSGAWVSTVSPDQPASKLAVPGVNIFLYQISPNAALRNRDLPTRAADGTLLNKPTAAVDLHYLLTFYGDDSTLEPQRLLGATTLALHTIPTLPLTLIQTTQASNPFLTTSNLDTQDEQIRFTPVAFSLEELSKLWSFLLKVDYVLSTAYIASVVLIDADGPAPAPALPVLTSSLVVQPIRQPVIASITASPNPTALITAGSDITLSGSNLAAPSGSTTQILIGGQPGSPASINPVQITLPLPAGLAAGPQTAQVLQPLNLGVPPVLHPGTGGTSGIATFVLTPLIAPTSPPGGYQLTYNAHYGSPAGPAVVATLIPQVQPGQSVFLQLIPTGSPPASAVLITGPTPASLPTSTIGFPATGIPAGTYAARVLVAGAASPVTTGPGGIPTAPLVTIP